MTQLELRNLQPTDLHQVRPFEENHGYDLSSAEDVDNTFSFGLFREAELVAVATLGSADVLGEPYRQDLILSDVAVKDGEQGKGYGQRMVLGVLKDYRHHTVHAFITDDDLIAFYAPLGFKVVEEGHLTKEAVA